MNVDNDRLVLTQQLHALINDYWFDVDRNWGRTAHELFAEDGDWDQGRSVLKGRAGVRAFYRAREEHGNRVVLHAIENFRAYYDGAPDKAIATWAMVLTGGDGEPGTVLPSRAPVGISYMTENWILTEEGWKIKLRVAAGLFAGGEGGLGKLDYRSDDPVVQK